jgi:polysaccharide export outer membrane protein
MIKPSDTRFLSLSLALLCALPLAAQIERKSPVTGTARTIAAQRFATLGPGDLIRVDVLDLPELSSRDARIGVDGSVSLPHVGSLRAEGLTTAALESSIDNKLSEFMYDPRAAVTVVEQASRPVYVLGSVRQPGAQQMRGELRLLEALSLAGGLAENSGHALTLTRRLERGDLPLAGARTDAAQQYSIVEIPLEPLITSSAPETNLLLMPDDVVSVMKADLVYVVGHVERAGGFVLEERETVTALKALALAGGLKAHAAPRRAKILRREAKDTEAEEVPVDLKAILDGKVADVSLSPEDVLFVPKSGAKTVSAKAADTVLSTLSGILIWRR